MALAALALILAQNLCAAPLTSRQLDQVPLNVLPTAALETVWANLPQRPGKQPPTLALTVPMPLGLDSGAWSIDGETAIWRTRLYSAGATVLIAHFDRFELPDGAELYIMDTAGEVVQGPYTSADQLETGGLWTAMVPGEEALLELRVDADSSDQVLLQLAELGHGVDQRFEGSVAPKSGSCNIDVACPQGNAWRNSIRASVRLQIPSGLGTVSLCSGQMMNNSARDNRPLVLTANHCGVGANASGVIAYFNYQTSTCGGTPDGSLQQNISANARLFTHPRSDHTLIQLSSIPPASFNAYLSGYNASLSDIPISGASIHHPSGDEKRISLFNSSAQRQNNVCLGTRILGTCNGTEIDTFTVQWSSGVTEQGSSGGGLWNQSGQLVGVLSGGSSSCANPGLVDAYGRLDVAWSAGLAAFLDPAGSGRALAGAASGAASSGGVSGGTGGGSSDGGSTGGSSSPAPSSGGGGGGGGAFGASIGLFLLASLQFVLRARRRNPINRHAM